MNYGFVKTAVVTPKIKVADVAHNGAEIEKLMKEHSDMTPIVEKYREYKKVKTNYEDACEMMKEDDKEIKDLEEILQGLFMELLTGLEPVTSALPRRCTTDCAITAYSTFISISYITSFVKKYFCFNHKKIFIFIK